MRQSLTVEVISDFVCPWCYVGKKRLEKAIAQRPELEVCVQWQPFQLSPDMPREGRKRVDHYREIFGERRANIIMETMKDTGKAEGIDFCSSPDAMSPNTLSAHALMLWARETPGVDTNDVAEKLFRAHHVECEDIGDQAVLRRIAGEAGMAEEDVAERLAAREDEQRLRGLIQQSLARGVSGVPFFMIEGRYGMSGAQPAEMLLAAFDQIAAEKGSAEAAQ